MKRFIPLTIIAILAAGLFWPTATLLARRGWPGPTSPFAAQVEPQHVVQVTNSTELSLSPTSQTADVSDLISVAVNIDQEINPLNGFQFDLMYDAAVVQLNGIATADFLSSTGRQITCPPVAHIDTGHIRFACASTGSAVGATGDGTLATLTFQAIGNGSTDLSLTAAQLVDTDTVGRTPSTSNGQISVGQDITTTTTPSATPTATATTSTATPTPTATTNPSSSDENLYLPLIIKE